MENRKSFDEFQYSTINSNSIYHMGSVDRTAKAPLLKKMLIDLIECTINY